MKSISSCLKMHTNNTFISMGHINWWLLLELIYWRPTSLFKSLKLIERPNVTRWIEWQLMFNPVSMTWYQHRNANDDHQVDVPHLVCKVGWSRMQPRNYPEQVHAHLGSQEVTAMKVTADTTIQILPNQSSQWENFCTEQCSVPYFKWHGNAKVPLQNKFGE